MPAPLGANIPREYSVTTNKQTNEQGHSSWVTAQWLNSCLFWQELLLLFRFGFNLQYQKEKRLPLIQPLQGRLDPDRLNLLFQLQVTLQKSPNINSAKC